MCQTGYTQHSLYQLESLPNLEGQQGSGFGHQVYKLSVSSLILSPDSLHYIPELDIKAIMIWYLSCLSSSESTIFFLSLSQLLKK